jgi:hypothetical protein
MSGSPDLHSPSRAGGADLPLANRPSWPIDSRDPFGRARVGVKVSDEMRRQPPPDTCPWRETDLGQLQRGRQRIVAARDLARSTLDHWHRMVEIGSGILAEEDARRAHGPDCPFENAVAKELACIEQCDRELVELDRAIVCRLWAQMFPDAPTPAAYEELELREAAEGKSPLGFDHADTLWAIIWEELSESFADQEFGVNAEILIAMQDALGLVGACELISALRHGDASTAQRFCDLITQEEKERGFDCHNRLLIRRRAKGSLLILIDQVGNPDYVPPLVLSPRHFVAPHRRLCARDRSPQGASTRTRGSRRRTSSRSTGGGSSGDDPPDGEPERATGPQGSVTGTPLDSRHPSRHRALPGQLLDAGWARGHEFFLQTSGSRLRPGGDRCHRLAPVSTSRTIQAVAGV